MSLDVQIKIEGANPAASAADRVTDALGRTEDAGEKVGDGVAKGMAAAQRALSNLGRGFQSLEAAMNARARATQIHTTLNNTLANSFAGVSAQIAREKQMLDSIHGPMQRYEQDVRTLDMLMSKGAITASQYAAALAKSRSAAGMANPMSAVSLPKGPGAAPKQGGGMGLGGAAAMLGVTLGAREALELGDSYIGLENRMRQVTKSQDELNASMARIKQIANSTRSDIATTGESYVRLVQATKSMGISSERAFKITETLSMALQSSGASASEAAAGTLQLMQAMGAGALQGDEFRSVAENMPILLDVLSKQLGVTRGELKKMGAEGKITTEVMVKALESMGDAAKKNFDESEMTFAQATTVVKNYAKEALGGGISITKAWNNWGAATQALRLEEIELGNAMARVNPWFGQLVSGATQMTAATYALTKSQLEHMQSTDRLVRSLMKLAEMQEVIKGIRFQSFANDLAADAAAAAKAGNDAPARREAQMRDFATESKGFSSGSALEMSSRFDPKVAVDDIGTGISKATLNAITLQRHLEKSLQTIGEHERALEMAALSRESQRYIEQQEKMRENYQKIGDAIGSNLGDALVDAALTGELSFASMVDKMIADLARLAAQQLINAALTRAISGATGPTPVSLAGNPAGTILDPKAWGFAQGGSFTVGGTGGTDTTPVAFMATPGERVTVETPQQQRSSDRGSGGAAPASVTLVLDERAMLQALKSPMGARVIDDVFRKNPGLLRR